MQIIPDSQWINGLDSVSYSLGPGMYQWSQNVVNRGGIIETRQGFAEVASIPQEDPRGCAIVTIGGVAWLLAAIGEQIYKLNLNIPSDTLHLIPGLSFPSVGVKRQVHFEVCVQAQETLPDNTTRLLPTPKFVVVIQDGRSVPQYWDGVHAGTIHSLYPDTDTTPVGTYLKWAGDRLWVANGRKLHASNLLNPFQFTEEEITASGGFFFLPDNVTGMGVTHDYKSLLVFTDFTTSAIQVGLEDRTTWPNTQDFQRVILPSIGCTSHRTIINMYGMTWWMSHDGLIGLDSALSAFQSSRLDIQDQNMARSKEGINWTTGGGCSGSYGNFLFFSVPSGSKWNNHTWVQDQAVINTLAGISPPAWCSNWTGIRPEQWVTGQIRGTQRCFCISRDLTPTGHQSTIWEAFIGQRMDVPKDGETRKAKDIGCALETRFLGISDAQYVVARWVELDIAEIVGNVSLQVYYCGRRTSYKKIIDTTLTSSVSPGTEEVFNEEGIPVYVPQYRTIRSVTDVHSEDDNDPEIQTDYLRNKDREFSILIQWSGQMAVAKIRLAVDQSSDYMEGGEVVNESLDRRITAEGEGSISGLLSPANSPTGKLTSQFMSPLKPRWVEFPSYDSAVPNGVFFVAELQANPPPGAYPSNTFPVDVNLTSETQGIDIYYTRDNTHPAPPPHQQGTHYPPKPHITMGQTLRAIGTRDGLRNSAEFVGQYTQIQCAQPVFNPVAGDYPPDDFPKTIHITTPTAEAEIRYVVNNTPAHVVTHNSHLYDPLHPPTVDANQYLHARTFKDFYLPSDELVSRYHQILRCATPTCAPDGGAYPSSDYGQSGKSVAMGCTTQGATLRYTINNTDVEHGTPVANPHTIHVHPDDVLRVIAQKSDRINSLTKTATYTTEVEQVSTPVITPNAVVLTGNVHERDVNVSCATTNVTMSYVIVQSGDNTFPSRTVGTHVNASTATIHIGPPTNSIGHRILRVMAFRQDMDDSNVAEGTYDHEGTG